VAGRREDAKILGFQTIEPYYSTCTPAFDHVALMGTFVELLQRRQGIGTGLSQATFEAARRKGYEKIFTYLRADNLSALAFYLQLGFRIVGTAQKQARFGARYVDEIIIETFLWRSRVGMVGSKDCDGLWRPACESLDRVLRRPVSSLVIHQRPSV
jgi:L-amino acid N-acyltransferase YncA